MTAGRHTATDGLLSELHASVPGLAVGTPITAEGMTAWFPDPLAALGEAAAEEMVAEAVLDLSADTLAAFLEAFEADGWRWLAVVHILHPSLPELGRWVIARGDVLLLVGRDGRAPHPPAVLIVERATIDG